MPKTSRIPFDQRILSFDPDKNLQFLDNEYTSMKQGVESDIPRSKFLIENNGKKNKLERPKNYSVLKNEILKCSRSDYFADLVPMLCNQGLCFSILAIVSKKFPLLGTEGGSYIIGAGHYRNFILVIKENEETYCKYDWQIKIGKHEDFKEQSLQEAEKFSADNIAPEKVITIDMSWKFFPDKTVEMDFGPNTDKVSYELFKEIISGEWVKTLQAVELARLVESVEYRKKRDKAAKTLQAKTNTKKALAEAEKALAEAGKSGKFFTDLDLINKFFAVEDKSITAEEIDAVMKVEQSLLRIKDNDELFKKLANTYEKDIDLNQDKIYMHLSNNTQKILEEKCIELKIDKNKVFGALQEINEQKLQVLTIDTFFSKKDYNTTTLARMIEKAAREQKIYYLSDSIFELLSDESKAKIEEIATEMQERNKTNGLLLGIQDIINIVVNFFATIFRKGINGKEFDELVRNFDDKKLGENKFSEMIKASRDNPYVPLPTF